MHVCPPLLLLGFSSKPHDVINFCDPLGQGNKLINFNVEYLEKTFFENLSLSGLGLYPIPVRVPEAALTRAILKPDGCWELYSAVLKFVFFKLLLLNAWSKRGLRDLLS